MRIVTDKNCKIQVKLHDAQGHRRGAKLHITIYPRDTKKCLAYIPKFQRVRDVATPHSNNHDNKKMLTRWLYTSGRIVVIIVPTILLASRNVFIEHYTPKGKRAEKFCVMHPILLLVASHHQFAHLSNSNLQLTSHKTRAHFTSLRLAYIYTFLYVCVCERVSFISVEDLPRARSWSSAHFTFAARSS